MDSYEYRKGDRTNEEFKRNIELSIILENKYLLCWINKYNKGRGRKELIYKPWGNTLGNKIIKENDKEIKKVVKPDYIIDRVPDGFNNCKKSKTFPLEVQTCRSLEPEKIYVRCHKIDYFLNSLYDPFTKRVIDDGCHILMILGTSHIGYEKYQLLKPNFLLEIIKNGREYPNIYQGKPCYWFYRNDIQWKSFDGRTKQKRLGE